MYRKVYLFLKLENTETYINFIKPYAQLTYMLSVVVGRNTGKWLSPQYTLERCIDLPSSTFLVLLEFTTGNLRWH